MWRHEGEKETHRFATALSRGLVFVGCARLADLRTTVGDITGVVVVMEVLFVEVGRVSDNTHIDFVKATYPATTVKVSNTVRLKVSVRQHHKRSCTTYT